MTLIDDIVLRATYNIVAVSICICIYVYIVITK